MAGVRTLQGPTFQRKTISLSKRKDRKIADQMIETNKNLFRRDIGGGSLIVAAMKIVDDSNQD